MALGNPGGGPTGPRPNPATPGENGPKSPNYSAQINRWQDKLKGGNLSKKRQKTLRGNIQEARVGRWSDKIRKHRNDPLPFDAAYNDQLAGINKSYNDSIAFNTAATSMGLRGFGLEEQYKNPFSRAGALESAWKRDQRTTLNSYASAGQLYSGALANAQLHDDNAYTSDLHNLQAEQDQFLAERLQAATDAQAQRQADTVQALNDWRARMEANPPTNAERPPKFVGDYKSGLKDKLGRLREKKADAKNKYSKKKYKQKIKATKKDLKSIPSQYGQNNL